MSPLYYDYRNHPNCTEDLQRLESARRRVRDAELDAVFPLDPFTPG
jgi:hypothetical protein